MKSKQKYGAFSLEGSNAYWNHDKTVMVNMQASSSNATIMEGMWNPSQHCIETQYKTAMTGLCIWGKYDCTFTFKSLNKGNPGAVRSLSNPKDKADVFKRLSKGQPIDFISLSATPFGRFQTNMIAWQADVVARYQIEKLYYSLPIEEYTQTLNQLENFIPTSCVATIYEILNQHHDQLENKIKEDIQTEVEFIHPLRDKKTETIKDSYVWPYQALAIDLGIEEMEEVRIPYQALKNGYTIPPILLGLLGFPCPYYERRSYKKEDDYIKLIP